MTETSQTQDVRDRATDVGPHVLNGKLFFRLFDGSSVHCTCIGDPYATQVMHACATRSPSGRDAALEEALRFIRSVAKMDGLTQWVEYIDRALQSSPQGETSSEGAPPKNALFDQLEKASQRAARMPSWLINPNGPSDPTREALERVYKHARGLCFGVDWNAGTAAKHHRAKLLASVNAIEPLPQSEELDSALTSPQPEPERSGTIVTAEAMDAFNAALEAPVKPNKALVDLLRGVPEGYKLVPVEPTEAMLEAGESTFTSGYTGTPTSSPDKVYQAMLAAAPSPPATKDAGQDVAEVTCRVGRWLSAALDDSQVCEEMKADIRAWMDAGQPNVQPVPQVAVEPVAWRWRHGTLPWTYALDRPTGPSIHLFQVQPLYASPQPVAQGAGVWEKQFDRAWNEAEQLYIDHPENGAWSAFKEKLKADLYAVLTTEAK